MGLGADDGATRRAAGRVNDVPDAPVRTTSQILRANVLTPVNAIMGSLLVVILVAGFPGDALFAGVIVSNSVIGTFQELRARRTLTTLAVLSAPRAPVVPDAATSEVPAPAAVADAPRAPAPGDPGAAAAPAAAATRLPGAASRPTAAADTAAPRARRAGREEGVRRALS